MEYTYISNEGPKIFLYRQGGPAVQFTSSASCVLFLQAIKGGRATIFDAILKNSIFLDILPDSAPGIVNDYFGQQSAFYMIGTADDFLACEHGASTLEGAFPALFEYVNAVLALGRSIRVNITIKTHP